jgi:pantothenate kinase
VTSLTDVISAATASVRGEVPGRFVIGITGPPGAGKPHVARFLGHPVVAMDGFHLRNEVLDQLGRRQRKGAPDTFDVVALVQLLDRIREGRRAVSVPAFSRELDEPVADAFVIEPDATVVLVEGNYLLLDEGPWAEVASRLDLSVYVEAPAKVRRDRLLARQVRSHGSPAAARRWIETVDEPNAAIVERTKERADYLVVPGELPGSPLW